jgi:hypothetical protein
VPRRSDHRSAAIRRLLDRATWWRVRLLVDALVLYAAASTAALFSGSTGPHWRAAAFPLLTLVLLYLRGTPEDRLNPSALDTVGGVLGAVSLAAIVLLAGNSLIGGSHPVSVAARLWLFSALYLGIVRCVLLAIRARAQRIAGVATPTLIVGAGLVGERVLTRLASDPSYGLRPVGFVDSDPLPRSDRPGAFSVPVLGGTSDLEEAIERTGARRVILAFSNEPDHILVQRVKDCERLGVDVSIVPRLFESISERSTLDHVGGLPLLSLRPTNPYGWQFAAKHMSDRVVGMLALIVLSPLLLAIAAGVRLTSPGPVLFRQRRVGRDGRVFDLLKFRTMREPLADGSFNPPDGCAPGGVEGEDRRTAFGTWLRETALDELPQFINLVRGEMSRNSLSASAQRSTITGSATA